MSLFFSAFPEQSVEVHQVIAEGDRVAAHHTHDARHGGDLLGLPPTGKRVTVTGIEIFRIHDCRIAEMWHQDDLLSLMQQLGILSGPEAARYVSPPVSGRPLGACSPAGWAAFQAPSFFYSSPSDPISTSDEARRDEVAHPSS